MKNHFELCSLNFELDWPVQFCPLVEKHGADKVFETGLRVLGFPPNWSFPSGSQIHQLYKAFQEQT